MFFHTDTHITSIKTSLDTIWNIYFVAKSNEDRCVGLMVVVVVGGGGGGGGGEKARNGTIRLQQVSIIKNLRKKRER